MHLTDWTLEQLAEETLTGVDHARAAAHVAGCRRCEAEVEAYRALFGALEGLPRFAPSADFGDQVMARVTIAPLGSPTLARLHRWLPSTRRGWAMVATVVVAPALPLLALTLWLLSDPLLSAASLGQWAMAELGEGARALASSLLATGIVSGSVERLQLFYAALAAVPITTLGIVLAVLAVTIPLSAWSLLRLTRTPTGSVTYAN